MNLCPSFTCSNFLKRHALQISNGHGHLLAQALHYINFIEPRSDRHEVLVETLKNPEKLAKTLLRIAFLTACRREKLKPRFIEEALRPIQKIFSERNRIESKCNTFAHSLLNEAIAEAHRRKY